MSTVIAKKIAPNSKRIWYHFELSKAAGKRISAGIFTYIKPKTQLQRNHNAEALIILETKSSQLILDHQSVGTSYVPIHKIKANFFDFYDEFVKQNASFDNRHLSCSYNAFKKFLRKDFISASEIDETTCQRFRKYLLDKYNGETLANYFARFKKVIKAANKKGYFSINPVEDIQAKSNNNVQIKEILTPEEYQRLMNTPCLNYEVKKAFVVSLYCGFRWIDVKRLSWTMIMEKSIMFYQKKTKVNLETPLHPIVIQILGERKEGLVFHLPTANGCNKILLQWCKDAAISKHITWHCARHSFSVLLQRKKTNISTVAGMLAYTSTKYVHKIYQRYSMPEAVEAIKLLPEIVDPKE